jgi:signal transduction histidine kinase/ligand-binding sensor domain-containing protein
MDGGIHRVIIEQTIHVTPHVKQRAFDSNQRLRTARLDSILRRMKLPLTIRSGKDFRCLTARSCAFRAGGRSFWRNLAFLLALLTEFALPSAWALDPSFALNQYQHTAWTEREGAPTDVRGFAQTLDGYLLVASPRGLARFDGFSFEPVRQLGGVSLREESILSLSGGRRGELYIGFEAGKGAGIYREGRLRRLPDCNLTPGAVAVEDATWLICNQRLFRVTDRQIEPIGDVWGFPPGQVLGLALDSHGTVWVSAAGQLLSLPAGGKRFQSFSHSAAGPVDVGPDGSVWVTESNGPTVRYLRNGVPSDSQVFVRAISQLQFDRDGGVWAGGPQGLSHWASARLFVDTGAQAGKADTLGRASGLTSEVVTAMYEDERGSIWVGTAAGVERFKNNHLFPIRLPGRSVAFSIAAADDGSLWAANFFGHLLKVSTNSIQSVDEVSGGLSVLSRDRAGVVWVAGDKGRLWSVRGAKISRAVDVPADISGSQITSVSTDPTGGIWIGSTISGAVGNYANGSWSKPPGRDGAQLRWSSRTLMADSKGRVWASRRYDMTLLEHGAMTRFTSAQGLSVGEIFALAEGGDRIWVGGTGGVSYFNGVGFQTLKPALDGAFREVVGLLEAANGDLWVHNYDSVVYISAGELQKQYRKADYAVQVERFDTLNGLYGTSPPSASRGSLVEGVDGRIWVSTSEGVMFIDPKKPRPTPYQPKVRVEGFSHDGKESDLSQPISLPRATKTVRFLYTAASPWGAERVRFRYRLEGVDTAWTEAGNRRAITYNSLAPGDYIFRVASTDDTGAWIDNEETLRFQVDAFWYEKTLIRSIYTLVAASLIWTAYRWQVRRMTSRVRWQMRMQQAEREHIARDLHDTLLQGVHGLTWRIQTIANTIAKNDPVREKLETALDTAENLLVESRRRVSAIREPSTAPRVLSQAIEQTVAGASLAHPAEYIVKTEGIERPVQEVVQVDICDIVREAFINAALHASPKLVFITLEYLEEGIVVTIADDGVGIEPGVARKGRAGHFGIAGMRERASELGGTLYVGRREDRGTEVVFRLRRARAFSHRPCERWARMTTSIKRKVAALAGRSVG